jgi:hypothetical protein
MLKTLTEMKLIPLPIHSGVSQFKSENSIIRDATNYGIFDYSQETQLKYTSVQKFYPKTYPMQNTPKITIQHHWTS